MTDVQKVNQFWDDIRDEINKAGGGATDSQVMAMTASRNRVIQKQYNALATQYDAAQTNIQAMMQYATQDQNVQLQRQQMTASVTESLASISTQMAQLGMTMQNNARSAYQTAVGNLGYKQFASAFQGDTAGLFRAQQLLFPGSEFGTTLTDPNWVSEADSKWQLQQNITAASKYFQLYGQWPSWFKGLGTDNGGGGTPGTPAPGTPAPYSGKTVVGGIDFGNMPTGVGAYATDIGSELAGVGRSYNEITGVMGQNPTAAGLDSYIQNNAKGSPVTGQMIIDAAKQANISPAILAATLNNESQFGTAGVGARTNNPGNVGNTGTSTTQIETWQAGVQATAQQLARRSVSNYSNSSNQVISLANQLVTGNLAPSQVPAKLKGSVETMANQLSQNINGQPFDATQAEAAYKFNASTKTQMMKSSLNFAIGSLSRLKDLSQGVDRTSVTYGNAAGQWLKYNGSDPKTVDFVTMANAAIDDVGAALGGGVSTDAKLGIARKIIDTTLSQDAFDSQINTDIYAVALRQGMITQQGRLGGANTSIPMTSPDGKMFQVPYDQIHNFQTNGYKLN